MHGQQYIRFCLRHSFVWGKAARSWGWTHTNMQYRG